MWRIRRRIARTRWRHVRDSRRRLAISHWIAACVSVRLCRAADHRNGTAGQRCEHGGGGDEFAHGFLRYGVADQTVISTGPVRAWRRLGEHYIALVTPSSATIFASLNP